MNLLDLFEGIFRCTLLLLSCFYAYKNKYKISKAAITTLVFSFLPAFLWSVFWIRIDTFSRFVYYIVLFMSLYLGSSFGFYDHYKWWDRVVHCLSGIGFVGFGIAIAVLSPGAAKPVVLLLGFSFSLSVHMIWEVLEYLSDCITHGNAQRWQIRHNSNNHISEQAIQPAGLVDTMNDMICCISGAVFSIMIWWIVL